MDKKTRNIASILPGLKYQSHALSCHRWSSHCKSFRSIKPGKRFSRSKPIFVYEHQGEILGFLSLSPFNSRELMQHIAEASIYVKRSARGGGIGTALWRYTFAFAHRIGFKKIIAVCFPNNPALKLKQKMGFKIIGTYQHHVHRGGSTYTGGLNVRV